MPMAKQARQIWTDEKLGLVHPSPSVGSFSYIIQDAHKKNKKNIPLPNSSEASPTFGHANANINDYH